MGFESSKERRERIDEDYFTGIETLLTFLIEKQNRYRFTKAGLQFDSPRDSDAYDQILQSLKSLEEEAKRLSSE
jgi:hypothetical protein